MHVWNTKEQCRNVYVHYYYYYFRVSHFSALARKYSLILGFSNQQG